VAEKIRACLAEPYVLPVKLADDQTHTIHHRCTASIGVTLFGHSESRQDEILQQADAAMYQAKNAGRNRVQFY
jgi:diguanylate cyclase (GGDEF)-like protein